ncbi:MAG TPA: nitroreductase [Thermoleophilia bacterium]|nr:nitroreductase [Thermoleophilia bacterium]
MEFEKVIRGRRSIRAYTAEPVARHVITEILDEARWAPSSRNTQAWSVWVVSGAALERFKTAFKAALDREEPEASDLAGTATGDWPQACSARAVELMKTRAATLEAAGEVSGPAASLARMADCFGAPVLLVFGFEGCLSGAYASYDTASLVQNVCLAAHDKGLGTCQSTTLVRYPDLLRELLPGADEQRMVVAVTLGYPELEAPANTFARSRAPLDELVTWVS